MEPRLSQIISGMEHTRRRNRVTDHGSHVQLVNRIRPRLRTITCEIVCVRTCYKVLLHGSFLARVEDAHLVHQFSERAPMIWLRPSLIAYLY